MEKKDFEKDFQLILKSARLSEKQYRFFKNLVMPDSDTCGDIVKSFHKAGYQESGTSKYYAYQIYNSVKFQTVLTAYREKELKKSKNREFTIKERVTEGLNFIIEKTRLGGDLPTMRLALMDLAKVGGILIERHQVIDPVTESEIDKTKRIEAAQLAESRLLESPGDLPENIIDADFVDVLDTENEPELSNDPLEVAILS